MSSMTPSMSRFFLSRLSSRKATSVTSIGIVLRAAGVGVTQTQRQQRQRQRSMATSSQEEEPVHFFDITCSYEGPRRSWSPHTLRTRLVLNYKKIPYTQSMISYPDIAPLLRSLHVAPLKRGIPFTLPAILHPSCSSAASSPSLSSSSLSCMNDSWPIALHLEREFRSPEHPTIFPSAGSYALALAVQRIVSAAVAKGARIVIPKIHGILDPRGVGYFYETRTRMFGKPLPEVPPPAGPELDRAWKALIGELEPLAQMLGGGPDPDEGRRRPFLEGENPGYADFLIVSYLAWWERADVADWERLMGIGRGQFRRLWDACKPWLDGQGPEKEWKVDAKI